MSILRLAAAAAFALATASTGFAVDSALLQLVPPDSQIVAGLQAERTRNSPFGQFLLSRFAQGNDDLEQFISATGFDPRRDLQEAIFASVSTNPASPQSGRSLMVARGLFNAQQIAAYARGKGASFTNYLDVQIMTGSNPKAAQVAFLDNTLAIAGDPESVRVAIDRRRGGAPLPSAMTSRINDLGGAYEAWAVSVAPLGNLAPTGAQNDRVRGTLNSDLLRGIQQASGGIKFGNLIRVDGEAITRSPQDALALVDVVRFLGSMLTMNGPRGSNPELLSLLDSLTLTTEANRMKFSLSIPEDEMERAIRGMTPHGKVARR